MNMQTQPVADPEFPVGQLRIPFIKFVCQNERTWTLRGGAHWVRSLDLPRTAQNNI